MYRVTNAFLLAEGGEVYWKAIEGQSLQKIFDLNVPKWELSSCFQYMVSKGSGLS